MLKWSENILSKLVRDIQTYHILAKGRMAWLCEYFCLIKCEFYLAHSLTISGFLLAKDSLIKSSHASHPIAGRRPAAADGKRPGQRPGVTARVA